MKQAFNNWMEELPPIVRLPVFVMILFLIMQFGLLVALITIGLLEAL